MLNQSGHGLHNKVLFNIMSFTDLLSSFKPSPEGSSSQVRDLMQARDNIQNFLTEVLKTRVFNELFWFLVRNKYIPPNKVVTSRSSRSMYASV